MVETRALGALAVMAAVVSTAGSTSGAQPFAGISGRADRPAPTAPPAPAHQAAPARTAAPTRQWRPLHAAAATSFLQNDWSRYEENYHPNYVLDGNPATAWVAGDDQNGEGESITIPLSPIRGARALRLRIWNGYQKSPHLWTKNAMPQDVEVTVLDGKGEAMATVRPSLARTQEPQEVVIELPRKGRLASVRLTIRSVYEGEKFHDTCISDIAIDLDGVGPYNAAAEQAKAAALATWISERKAVAAYFATKPRELPFAFTKYTPRASSVDKDELKKKLALREERGTTLPPGRFRVATKGVRALPDGLADEDLHLADFADFFNVEAMSLRETDDPVATHVSSFQGLRNVWTSSARIARDPRDQGRVRAIAFDIKDVTTERTTDSSTRDLLLLYDAEGRLETVYRTMVESDDEAQIGEEGETRTDEIWSVSYDDRNKVLGLERESLRRSRRVRDKGLGQEREDRRARRVVYAGVAPKRLPR